MIEFEEARDRILTAIEPLPTERVSLPSAFGRVLRETIVPGVSLPLFDNSAVDGYAVQAEDVRGASSDVPVPLRLAGCVAAGEVSSASLTRGECIRIFTGSALPAGADAVVMQEDTRVAADAPKEICILDGVKPWENVRLEGEDVKAGRALLGEGERLQASRLGLLAAIGISDVTVGRRPVLGLLSTGSELVEAGQPRAPGRIFESNRALLAPLLERAGAVPKIFPIVPDSLEAIRSAMSAALNECDALVTIGGVSVGERDFVKQAFTELGGKTDFWRVSIKPGKPFVFGRCEKKFLFGLPGNPVSAAVTLVLLVRPAVWRWQGATDLSPETGAGVLAEPLANPGDRRHFVRVIVDGKGEARSAGAQASHCLASLAAANGLVDVPPRGRLAERTVVPVIRFGD